MLSLVRGSTIAEVNLNLYRRGDAPDSQIWAAGTWLNSLATEEWLERVTHLQAPGKATTAGYTPNANHPSECRRSRWHLSLPGLRHSGA